MRALTNRNTVFVDMPRCEDVVEAIEDFCRHLILRKKGTCIVLDTKRMGDFLGRELKPIECSVVCYYFEKLIRKLDGIVWHVKNGHSRRFLIDRENLTHVLNNGGLKPLLMGDEA